MSIVTNILTGGSNNHQTTSENANQVQTDFIAEGVVGAITNTAGVAPATGAFAVNAQGSPNMTVAVSSGVAYVETTPSGQAAQTLRAYNNASANVTIAANASGSTKYDWVYISMSAANAANPNTAGDNVATLVTSRSSSATADDGTPPSYGYALAVVTVANAASSITNGNIADKRLQTGASVPTNAWTGWVPTWANITVGNGTVDAKYTQIGKSVRFRLAFTLGSTSTVGTSPTFTLPITSVSPVVSNAFIGLAQLIDTGNTTYLGATIHNSTTQGAAVGVDSNSTFVRQTLITSSVPFTWATGDVYYVEGAYEGA